MMQAFRQVSRSTCYSIFKSSGSTIFTLTQESLTHRRPDFGVIGDFEVSHFERILDTRLDQRKSVLTSENEVESYNLDYSGQRKGASRLVLLPSDVEQLSDALKLCSSWNLGVVPQGGNTSLFGTGVPVFDEVIMSTRRMNKVLNIDADTGVVVCEAGVIPSDLEKLLSEPQYNLTPPVDLGSWEICSFGGNAATNARGMRSLKYPDFRSAVTGIEAVTATGETLNFLGDTRKDLVGVDLKQCLVGTEGTFGIISKVAFSCPQRPKSMELALFGEDFCQSVPKYFYLNAPH
ncbi:D-2-hydroxyglutarate dehydrogenase, mitochondrial [Sparganum proliferum]